MEGDCALGDGEQRDGAEILRQYLLIQSRDLVGSIALSRGLIQGLPPSAVIRVRSRLGERAAQGFGGVVES